MLDSRSPSRNLRITCSGVYLRHFAISCESSYPPPSGIGLSQPPDHHTGIRSDLFVFAQRGLAFDLKASRIQLAPEAQSVGLELGDLR